MSNIDWSCLVTKASRDAEDAERQRSALAEQEESWVAVELPAIADQLLAVEDDDPGRLPGTEREWRDYRIQVRAWKECAEGFPDSEKRPARPS